MASILIIESQPILRAALRQFLFPEHRTAARERWDGAADLERHDLVIVDRDSLEDGGAEALLRTLQRLGIPSVWLHQGPPPALEPARLTAAVAKPLDGAALEAALQSLLEASGAQETRTAPEARPDRPAPESEAPGGDTPDGDIIELTEVVDDNDLPGSDDGDSNDET